MIYGSFGSLLACSIRPLSLYVRSAPHLLSFFHWLVYRQVVLYCKSYICRMLRGRLKLLAGYDISLIPVLCWFVLLQNFLCNFPQTIFIFWLLSPVLNLLYGFYMALPFLRLKTLFWKANLIGSADNFISKDRSLLMRETLRSFVIRWFFLLFSN